MNRRAFYILLVSAGCFAILSVLFYADYATDEPEGLSATQRMQAERIVQLTRNEVAIQQERLDTLKALFDVIPKSEPAERKRVDDEYTRTTERLASAKQLLNQLETALANDDADAVEEVITRLQAE